MKRRKMAVGASIACLFIVIAIQAVLGGGMGLSINPKDEGTTPGSPITFDITVYNLYSTTESFYISVDRGSCDYGWFEWHTKSISIPGRGQGQVSLDVTPTQVGSYSFAVRAYLAHDPRGAQAIQTARISVPPPPVIVSSAPPLSVIDREGEVRTFNVTVNQTVNVSWYLNNTLQHTNVSTKEANYTLHAEVVGEHNVLAKAENPNGTDMQTWIWNVTAAPVLEINKTDNPDPVSPGGILNYSIRVNNTGNATATNVIVTETYDANVTFLDAVPAPSQGNDTWVFATLNVSEAKWINISVTVNASAPNGTVLHNFVNVTCAEEVTDSDTENTTVFVAPALPPNITSFAPPSPVNDTVCTWRTFNVTVNQTVNVSWYLNNTLQHTNVSTKEANYTLHAEVVGEHNVSAKAENPNGTDMQTWIWNVMAPSQFMIYGWVFYENGSACNNPIVNITNLNVSLMWPHVEKIDNYYELNLTPGIDINESEVLLFDVKSPDALPSNITIHWVTKDDINVSGLFPFNITLNYPPTCIALMPNISYQPQINGTNITWKACAFDPEGDELWFRFWLDGPRTGGIGNPTIVQNWSKSNVWIWETNGSDVGDNLIYADVRDGHHANNFTVSEYDLYERMWYWIT